MTVGFGVDRRMLMDLETALSIVDDNLPDGAYFAMLGELTGMHPAALADALAERGERAEQAKPPSRRAKKRRRKTRKR